MTDLNVQSEKQVRDLLPLALARLSDLSQLRDEAERRYQQADHFAQKLLRLQEEERRGFCYDIHDGVAQTLVPVLHYLQVLESLPLERQSEVAPLALKTRLLVQKAMTEVRAVLEGLRLHELGHLNLSEALRLELEHYQEEMGWQIDLHLTSEPDWSDEQQTLVYRIIKEGLVNIAKHAQTKRVALSLNPLPDGGFEIVLQDWGVGFEPKELLHQTEKSSIGLLAMQKRAEQLHAKLELSSQKNNGTTVHLILPDSCG